MSGRKEKEARRAAGVDLKTKRQRAIDEKRAGEAELAAAYVRGRNGVKDRISARSALAVAAALAVSP